MSQPVLSMEGISKEFPGVKALADVDFELYPGEVHALMGENGAGKSTLMKILSGVYSPTAGVIRLKGKEAAFRNPLDAQLQGCRSSTRNSTCLPICRQRKIFSLTVPKWLAASV